MSDWQRILREESIASLDKLKEKFGDKLRDFEEPYGLLTFTTSKENILVGNDKKGLAFWAATCNTSWFSFTRPM